MALLLPRRTAGADVVAWALMAVTATLGSCFVTIPSIRATSSDTDAGPDGPLGPAPGSCGLTAPTFCETFDSPAEGGRSGELDEARWNVARVGSSDENDIDWYPSSTLDACDASTVTPDRDLLVCGGQLAEAVTGATMAMRIRQEFDVTAATSTAPARIAFDVDAYVNSETFDIWFTDEALPFVPDPPSLGVFAPPRNGVGFTLDACPIMPNMTQLRHVYISTNGALETLMPQEVPDSSGCFVTQPGETNHIEIAFQPSEITFGASAAGQPSSYQQLSLVELTSGLPLTSGYVIFEHVPTNGITNAHVWDNIGFDGVPHATPHAADAPDVLMPGMPGGVNLGYQVSADNPVNIPFGPIDLSGAVSAHLAMSAWSFDMSRTIQYCFNPPNGSCHLLPSTLPASAAQDYPLVIDVDPTDLDAGANTISMAITQVPVTMFDTVVSNLTLTVEVEP